MKNIILVLLVFFAINFFEINTTQAQDVIVVEQEDEDTRELFDSWDAAIKNPEKVQILSLAYQDVTTISDAVAKFVNLEEIYLNDNKLTSLPAALFTLPKLKVMDISGNTLLAKIPSDIAKLTNLEYIRFGYHESLNYGEIFTNLGKLPKLKVVDIMSNKIRVLPSQIGALKQITKLNLADNRLLELPAEIGNLSNLEELDLSQNQLVVLPSSVYGLAKLKKLSLNGNLFSEEEATSIKQKFKACSIDL